MEGGVDCLGRVTFNKCYYSIDVNKWGCTQNKVIKFEV